MNYIMLDNGVKMPQEGYGVFQIPPEECERCVSNALFVGYRLIDMASAYGNEEGVGATIKKSGIPREELFITTKLWVQDTGYEEAKRAAEASMKRLGVDYLDLYLIHQPFGDYYSAWRAMEEILNIWDFILDSKDMDAIATMDIGHSKIINHYSACTAKALNATKIY